MSELVKRIAFVDSHTEGEPTRVVISGAPDIGGGPIRERLERLRRQDDFRRTVIDEPRGWEAMVGAVLCEPVDSNHAAGVIYFNNAGYLEMCGHGTIGVAVTLHQLGKIGLGKHYLETPAGKVEIELKSPNAVTIQNVPSYRFRKNVSIDVPEIGEVVGDVAWGGNWFFLVGASPVKLHLSAVDELTRAAWKVRRRLNELGIVGEDGSEIDHIEFFGPPANGEAHSRNFVLCPGGAYDRSPCGTGTSAKLACLASDGKWKPGETWIQESIIGSRFEASYELLEEERVSPSITGRAYICGQGELVVDPRDPFQHGIGARPGE